MEKSPNQSPKDNKNDPNKDKMEKRVKSLFAEQDPPSYVSNREVEAMKARIRELETELAGQQKEIEQVSAPSLPEHDTLSQPSAPVQPIFVPNKKTAQIEAASSSNERQKQIVLWLVGIWTILDLVFLSYLAYSVIAVHQNQFDLTSNILVAISVMVLISNLTAYQLVRRGRLSLGIGLVFFVGTLIPSISSFLIFQSLAPIGISYIVLMTLLIVSLSLPKNFKNWTVVAAVVSVLLSGAIEYMNPSFRVYAGAGRFDVLSNIFMGIAVFGLTVFAARQAANGNINTKLITAFVVVAVLSMGVVAFQSNRSLRDNLTSDIVESQAFLAKSQGLQIGQAITSQYDKLKGLASIKTLQDGTEAANLDESRPSDVTEIEQLNLAWREVVKTKNINDPLAIKVLYNTLSTQLRRFQAAFPENTEILITDDKGFSIAATTLPVNYYQADALWWRTAHTEGQYIGQPIFDPSTNSVALDMAVPIYSYTTGEFVGVMRTTVDFSVLTDLLIEGIHGQTGYSIIYQPNGQQIRLQALGDGTYKVIQEFASDDLQKFFDTSNTSQEFALNGVPVLVSSAPVGINSRILSDNATTALNALGWQVLVVQEKNEALQPINAQARNNLMLAIIVIVIVVVVSYILAGFISNPIIRLTAVASQIASGDLTAQAKLETNDEIGALAGTLNRMTAQLREILQGLEERVANRTHDLELANEVGKTITSKVDNLNELLNEAVEMIRARFDLYYTQVYTTDYSGHTILLRAGTGEVGKQLLSRNHHLLVNASSLNGRAVSEKQTVLVSNTLDNPNFLPNPLLPKTRSEMAVPLIAGDRIVGVLDMQSENADAFNKENQPAFEAMAGQLAIAIQNATLFEQAELARMEVEEQARRLSSSGWREFLNAVERSETIGYMFDRNDVTPLTETQIEPIENALTVPIDVYGAHIGEVQLADETNRKWTTAETEIIQSVMSRVAQHIETLRLLAQAESYRHEAEQVSRRLTSEGWSEYFRTRKEIADGFHYDQDKVQPLNGNGHHISSETAIAQPLTIHDEPIGMMTVTPEDASDTHAAELLAAVAEQLSDHIENLRLLEQAEQRRLELETVASVSSTVSTVLDPDKLLQAVVDMTKERFALYHAHIYLAEDEWKTLLLAAGAGEIGRKMVAQQHAIPMDATHSLVARASRERTTVIANNVKDTPDFLPNPMLPDTRAEMAIPMIVGTDVLGVFDVQSDKSGGFSKEDADIYTTLASQVAVALQNARLYVEQAATVTQLRELDRLKSAFLANMSHELRTPLNSILGFTDVMLEGLDGDLTDYMDNDLRLIQKNGRHLLHLINDVLDMAKIESGRMNLHPETFRIHELLEEVTSITAPLASEKNLSLFIDPGSDADIQIYADNTRLRQVMINLVNNSIKFTEKGKISLFVKPIDGARVLIAVKDTGIGIPQDHLEAVFQEFTQVDTSTTRKAGGTGLGLPISRRLIEMHGGRLWAESTGVSGEGSTFFVEMPLEAHVADIIEKQEK